MRGVVAALAVAGVAMAIAGCGGGAPPAVPGPAATATIAATAHTGPLTVTRAARLTAGTRGYALLTLPRVGRLLVDCGRAGPGVAFAADDRLPTADVVIAGAARRPLGRTLQPGRTLRVAAAAPALLQTWQIAPFAATGVRVTTITVAARRLPGGGAYACAASARATVSADQGATRTG